MRDKVIGFIKKETVLIIAAVLAAVSVFFVPFSIEYIDYIDFRTLILMLGLMLVMSGLRQSGFFTRISQKLLDKVSGIRNISFILVGLCFFTSMFITNDVALITFVPFSIEILGGMRDRKPLIKVIVLQTIAANMGSMLMPMGNPHNIYLYSVSNIGILEFIKIIFPYTLAAMIILFAVIMLIKNDRAECVIVVDDNAIPKSKVILHMLLFILCLLTVLRIIPELFMLISVVIAVLIFDRNSFKGVDYSLLLTFICFFIFVGNIGNISILNEWLSRIVEGSEVAVSILLSQAISNVPSSILLSGFSENYADLIIGTNLGGLGTVIASMASLISYKYYVGFDNLTNPEKPTKGKYLAVFTFWNVVFIVLLIGLNILSKCVF